MVRPKHTGGVGSILTAKGVGRNTSDIAAWDVDTFLPSMETGYNYIGMKSFAFSGDGRKLFVPRISSVTTVRVFELTRPWDIRSAELQGEIVVGSGSVGYYGIAFSLDGTQVYLGTYQAIRQYALSSPWDLTTASLVASKALGTAPSYPAQLRLAPDGTKILIAGNNDILYRHDMSTPWQISTAAQTATLSLADIDYAMDISDDGTKLFYVSSGKLAGYSLASGWGISGTKTAISFASGFSMQSTSGIRFGAGGKALYFCNSDGRIIQCGGF